MNTQTVYISPVSSLSWLIVGLKSLRKVIRLFASVKLAVVVIFGLILCAAVGTFVESEYNSSVAVASVYHSWVMLGLLSLLAVNLLAVMIDRLPWKKKHLGFLLAHIGILTLLAGSLITQKFGIDAQVMIPINETAKEAVVLSGGQLSLYFAPQGTHDYRPIFEKDLDPASYLHDTKMNQEISHGVNLLELNPFAHQEMSILPSTDPHDLAALHFTLKNKVVDLSRWLLPREDQLVSRIDLGMAQVILSQDPHYKPSYPNDIVLLSRADGRLDYQIYTGNKKTQTGVISQGQSLKPEWMDLEFQVTEFNSHSKRVENFSSLARPNETTTPAIKLNFKGKETWLALDEFTETTAAEGTYVLSFSRPRVPLGFDIRLKKFSVVNYEGTNRAKSYQSEIEIPDRGIATVAMNEPISWKGLTIYQKSFDNDANGVPVSSTFVISGDPGRAIKYAGTFFITLGIGMMFWMKRKSNSKIQIGF